MHSSGPSARVLTGEKRESDQETGEKTMGHLLYSRHCASPLHITQSTGQKSQECKNLKWFAIIFPGPRTVPGS